MNHDYTHLQWISQVQCHLFITVVSLQSLLSRQEIMNYLFMLYMTVHSGSFVMASMLLLCLL